VIRWLRNAALTLVGLLILLAIAGASYQAIEMRADARRFPEPGRLVDIGGYRLKLNCTGSGSPTVILEGGLGDISIDWKRVQAGMAQFSRVCSYDRAGYGGSDPGPMPRTSAQIAKELHTLMQNAGEGPPYLLVGHSFGGYNVRVFNGQYPSQVSGMVLVDATQEDQYKLLPEAWKGIGASLLKHYKNQARLAPLLIDLGVARLMLRARGIDEGDYLVLQSKYLKARASELEEIQISAEQARAAGNIGEKPLVVLTAGENTNAIPGLSKRDLDDFQRIWVDDLQMRLARLSTRGKRVIVPGSGHNIPWDRPDSIVHAVQEVCAAAITPNSHSCHSR
jgi:pimeloyl-ACP methyl ester carboxylesterase